MTSILHDNEIPLDATLVRQLIDLQFPEYQGLYLNAMSESGSSNTLYRLGDELLVRFPRQPGGSASIEKEQRLVQTLSDQLPVAVPNVIALGDPALGYPERWSVVNWIPGETLSALTPAQSGETDRSALAHDLADLVVALQNIEVSDALKNDTSLRWYRGDALSKYDRYARKSIDICRKIPDLDLNLDHALAIWENSLKLPGANSVIEDHWYHADLVCENLLVKDNKLTAVLDFGSLSIGDPTIDLHGAWELFNPSERELFRLRTGVSDSQWLLGRAWSLAIALGVFSYYWGKMPRRQHDRVIMAQAVITDVADNHSSWLT